MSSPANQLLREYLQQESDHGVTHVHLSEEAREVLRNQRKPQDKPVPVAAKMPPTVSPRVEQEVPPRQVAVPPHIEKREPQAAPVAAVSLPVDDKAATLKHLAMQVDNNAEIRELGSLRDIMVFATGNPDAEIVFVGEAPGAEEEKQREPFVGPAGQLLTKIIQAMGLRRSDVYITNICKYRPMIDDGKTQGTKNRAPTRAEMLACLSYVIGEINLIQPKVIVALGSTASTGLGIEGTVGKLRGRFSEFRGIPVMVTYHPSYLLRREQEDGGGIAEKRLVWEDMMKVMEQVGLPISDKQRAYFTKSR